MSEVRATFDQIRIYLQNYFLEKLVLVSAQHVYILYTSFNLWYSTLYNIIIIIIIKNNNNNYYNTSTMFPLLQ